jgi:hypothetical protein
MSSESYEQAVVSKFAIPAFIATMAGIGIDVMSNMLQPYWPDAPHWVFGFLFWLGFALTAIPLPLWGLAKLIGSTRAVVVVALVVGAFFAGIEFQKRGSSSSAQASDSPQLALLRVHYISNAPEPELVESENVLKPASFQFAQDGSGPGDGREIKWTLLVMTFDKPVTGKSIKVLFEGGDLHYEKRGFSARNASFMFMGPIGGKTIQIEVRP